MSKVIIILTASFLSQNKVGQESHCSTKEKQNRIWEWFFGSITDSRLHLLDSTPVDLSCYHPTVRRYKAKPTQETTITMPLLVKHVLLARLAELLHVTYIAKVVC
uniref:Uncharacterized protein n=1 Tax=Solanum lycopersicum TaxID=4081 RepID=A0A3Q7GFH1_SOLLC